MRPLISAALVLGLVGVGNAQSSRERRYLDDDPAPAERRHLVVTPGPPGALGAAVQVTGTAD